MLDLRRKQPALSRQNEPVKDKRTKEITTKKQRRFPGVPKIADDACWAQAISRGSF